MWWDKRGVNCAVTGSSGETPSWTAFWALGVQGGSPKEASRDSCVGGRALIFYFPFSDEVTEEMEEKKKIRKRKLYLYTKASCFMAWFFYNQCQEILCLCASNSERLLCLLIGKGPMDSVGQYSAEATFQVGLELSFLFVSLAPNFSPPLLTPLFPLPLILILILILLAAFTAVWDSLMKVRPIKENSTAHRVCMLFFRVRLFI